MAPKYRDLGYPGGIQCDNTGLKPLQVPGIGLLINFEVRNTAGGSHFRHGAMDWTTERLVAREVVMIKLMDNLTDKPDWHKGMFDDKIMKSWRKEARGLHLISRVTWHWCLEELRDKARQFEKTGWVFKCDTASRCVVSDRLISDDLKHDFQQAVKPLLEEEEKDWQPHSNETVLNLVHPSLYPLLYNRTRVLSSGQVQLDDIFKPPQDCIIPVPEPLEQEDEDIICRDGDTWSAGPMDFTRHSWNFQWLPCEVAFSPQTVDGDSTTAPEVRITSYINNLHPARHENEKLYSLLSRLVGISIPLWNEILIKNRHGRRSPRISATSVETKPATQPEWASMLTNNPDSENWEADVERVQRYLERPDNPYRGAKYVNNVPRVALDTREEIESSGGLSQIVLDKFHGLRRIVHPEPGYGFSYSDWSAANLVFLPGTGWMECPGTMQHLRKLFISDKHDLVSTYREEGLQVIIKIASIELTPDRPRYAGGDWHISGMLNEHIVATSTYYFDSKNITRSAIRFRQEAKMEGISCGDNDHEPLETVFGVDSLVNEPAIQELSSVTTPEGRLVCFPNTLQHKVEPFELLDSTKPGHQRVAVIWLVDPDYRILSTRNVPPQQHDWWLEHAQKSHMLEKLPMDVQMMVSEEMKKGLITREQADACRLKLMEERAQYTKNAEQVLPQYNFF